MALHLLRALACTAIAAVASSTWAQPANDACADAITIPSVPFTTTGSLTDATFGVDGNDVECHGDQYNEHPNVWFVFTAPQAMALQVDTYGTPFDTMLAVHEGTCGLFTAAAACNNDDDDIDSGTEQSRLVVTLAAGQTVYIEVEDRSQNGGTYTLTVSATPIVQVSKHPDDGHRPSVTAVSDGGFIVVWRDNPVGSSDDVIVGRKFTSGGFPVGPQFAISTTPADYPDPGVAAGGSNVVAVWGAVSLKGRRLDIDGTALGPEFPIAATLFLDRGAVVAADPAGSFTVAWVDLDGDGSGIVAQRYDALGTLLGVPFPVNTTTAGDQDHPSISADGLGNVVVVWDSGGQDGDQRGVYGQRYDSDGAPLGGEFPVNDITDGDQLFPSVAAGPSGSFLVSWQDSECFFCTDARRFDATGAPIGSSFRIADGGGIGAGRPLSAAADGAGNYVVAWWEDYRLFSRTIAGDGTLGTDFQVTHIRDGYQYHPGAAFLSSGKYVVVWEWSPFGSHYDVMSRVIDPGAPQTDCQAQPIDASACRQPVVPRKSLLTLKDRSNNATDSLTSKWARGAATAVTDFGDPIAGDGFRLCVYDEDRLIRQAAIPGGGTCNGKPCWKTQKDGFKYTDGAATADGIKSVVLRAGEEGRASIVVKGKGGGLSDQALLLSPPARVQFLAQNGTCWEAEFDGVDVKVNTTEQFKAKG